MDNGFAILALKALDSLSMRSSVTAQNIANAGTPGYRALAVSFEDALAAAARQGDAAVAALSPTVAPAPVTFGADAMRLDLELQTASATALRYGAVVDVLDRTMQMNALAVSGGR